MGQQCCQVATNQELFVAKPFAIHENQFQPAPQFDKSDPFLNSKLNDLQSLKVYQNPIDNRYFIGQWVQSYPEGVGTLYIPEQFFYNGTFCKGIPSGEGEMVFLNKNEEYKGHFQDGKANGQGLYKNNNKKFTFEGQWKDSKPQKGVLVFEDNLNILKIEINDFLMGKAHILYKDLREYNGSINQQLFIPEGEGELKFIDGSTYKGNWKNGLMNGFGKYQWKDGSKYEGNYVNGRKQGNGVFYYTSGKQYIGMWSNGKQQGQGKIITKDGEVQKQGIWKDGIFQRKIQTPQKQENQSQSCNRNQLGSH